MKKIFTSFIAVLLTTICTVAQLPYNTLMTQSHFDSSSTKIASSGDNGWDNGVRLGGTKTGAFSGPAWNWDDKYIIIALSSDGIPHHITCNTSTNSSSTTDTKFYVATSLDNKTYTEKWSSTNRDNTIDLELAKDVKYIKICYSGNFAGYFKNIKVTELKEFNAPSVSELNVGKEVINSSESSNSLTIGWCNVPTIAATITGNNADKFSATISNNAAIGKYGTATINVTYKHNTVGTHTATLSLSSNGKTYNVSLTGTTTKKPQTITWNDDIANIKTTDNITLNATATTAISYTSSDNSIAEIVGNTLSIKKHGKVTITATAAETDIYASVSQTKEVTISAAVPEITWPKVAPITYGTPLTFDMLVGGTANVPGNFECSELPITLNAGTHKIAVRFVPENQNIYTIVEEKIDIIVNKADATITTIPNAINDLVYRGEEQTLITEGSAEGGKIVYSLDGNTFTENVPTATNAGEYTVYYNVVGDENYNDVESANTIIVTIKKATLTITAEDKSVTYGEEAPTYSAAYSGWKAQDNEDVLAGEMTFECEYNTNSNVGTYAINISGVEAQNYEITFVSGVLTVNKADATITNTPNAINDLVYSGEEQTLITEGSAEGGKIVYSLDGNTFTENVPTATHAGEYTVYYKVVGDENHNDVAGTNPIVVTIKKAILTITAEDKSVTYGEEAPTYSAAYSGWKAQDNEDVLAGEMTFECEYNTNSNVGTYAINISGVEAQNYEITFVSGVLTVNKADATITNTPNAINDLVYSGEEQTLITEGSAEGGRIVYSLDGNTFTEDVPTATNAGEYTVYYKVVEDENHNGIEETNSIVVIIKKATQSITWNDNIENIQTIDNITLNAIANTDIHYTSSDSTIAYVENKTLIINKYGIVTITAIAKESNNYTQAIESKDITISRATPSITWNISATLTVGNSIHLDAVASNNAEVLYEIIGEEGILKYDNQAKTLTAMAAGTTTILAYTEENDIYNAAEYQYTITVVLDSNPSTNITNTTINGEKAQKIFVNGKLYIIRNNQWYDTTGKLVK